MIYDEAYAQVYDSVFRADAPDAAGAVHTLRQLVGEVREDVLEYGAGTGRISIPLALSHNVTAVEPSPHMRRRLDEKRSPAAGPRVVDASMLDYQSVAPQALVCCLLGTLACLTTVDEQRLAISAMGRNVREGGWLVIESFNARVLDRSIGAVPLTIEQPLDTRGTKLTSTYQRMERNVLKATHIWSAPGKQDVNFCEEVLPVLADEVVAWASDAGLQLKHRWGDWRARPLNENDDGLFILAFARTTPHRRGAGVDSVGGG